MAELISQFRLRFKNVETTTVGERKPLAVAADNEGFVAECCRPSVVIIKASRQRRHCHCHREDGRGHGVIATSKTGPPSRRVAAQCNLDLRQAAVRDTLLRGLNRSDNNRRFWEVVERPLKQWEKTASTAADDKRRGCSLPRLIGLRWPDSVAV